jgi:hypothetical protein
VWPAGAVSVDLALVHRELGQLAFRRLPLRSWQRGSNQPAMDRALVFDWRRFRSVSSIEAIVARGIGGGFRCLQRDGVGIGSIRRWHDRFLLYDDIGHVSGIGGVHRHTVCSDSVVPNSVVPNSVVSDSIIRHWAI